MQSGRYFFTSQEAHESLGASPDGVKLAINLLRRKGDIASPARGFYVMVPPEYRALGCLPADQFIPALMEKAETPYYAPLLSAAQCHGAAHNRPQEFQVMLGKPRRPIECGKVRVVFHARKRVADVPMQRINTPRGTMAVSTPAATASISSATRRKLVASMLWPPFSPNSQSNLIQISLSRVRRRSRCRGRNALGICRNGLMKRRARRR
jgi:hypothetical protein